MEYKNLTDSENGIKINAKREKFTFTSLNALVIDYGLYDYELKELLVTVRSKGITNIFIKITLSNDNKNKAVMKGIVRNIYDQSYQLKKAIPLINLQIVDGNNNTWITNALPMNLTVETNSTCNLRCVGCRETVDKLGFMKFEAFKGVLRQFHEIENLKLYSTGEPLLHPDIISFIEYSKAVGVKFLELSTNLNIKNDKLIKEIAKTKLDRLIIGLDGASQDTYQTFRRGGNFRLVCSNIKKLRAFNPNCELMVQLIPNKLNEHDIGKVKALATYLGADAMRIKILGSEDREYLPTNNLYRWEVPVKNKAYIENIASMKLEFICKEALSTMIILWDGSVFPCCYLQCSHKPTVSVNKNLFPQKFPYNIFNDTAQNIWMDEDYFQLRYSFLEENHRLLCKLCITAKQNKPSGRNILLRQ